LSQLYVNNVVSHYHFVISRQLCRGHQDLVWFPFFPCCLHPLPGCLLSLTFMVLW
ncbi:hypothetical protein BAE44_0001643, partial [Dichanthelium oligosanthes]